MNLHSSIASITIFAVCAGALPCLVHDQSFSQIKHKCLPMRISFLEQ